MKVSIRIALIIKTNSSSSWASWPTTNCPPSVVARFSSDDSTRRESMIRFAAGKRNLLNLNSESSPRQRRSASSTGSTRMSCSSINPSASAAVASGFTLRISAFITSRILGDTSATKRGDGTPNVSSTKSIRSLVSPQRAATASGMPVRRLNSA